MDVHHLYIHNNIYNLHMVHNIMERETLRAEDATQFSIGIETKNRLDRFKMDRKEKILASYKRRRRMVTNDLAIVFLLDIAKKYEMIEKQNAKKHKEASEASA